MVPFLRKLLDFREDSAVASRGGLAEYRHGAESFEALAGIRVTAFDTMTSPIYAICSYGCCLLTMRHAGTCAEASGWNLLEAESLHPRTTASRLRCGGPDRAHLGKHSESHLAVVGGVCR